MTSSQNGDHFANIHDFRGAEAPLQTPSDSYDPVDNRFGDPEILPRIGDEYQVEIPQLIREPNNISHSRECIVAETRPNPCQNFLIGLPIPLTWISSQRQDSKIVLETGKYNGPGYFLVPGLFDESWSAAEKDSFLLGLYIFEKNFVEVRRFVGTKHMGALLSFYYGKFCGSQEYHRWSECRKMKSKKGVYGRRIFSGLRQQELMSRILPRVSEECRNTLSEVSKTFSDEKISLADYVSSLKSMVGLNILVEAVGIGTGKQDLTTMALEPSRSNQIVPMRPEIPTGKACSSLTTSEIIKFLSGDYRLSKARSNDLFWEAVWPRLLARGWHSEQPKNQGYVKNCLVFLTPGIKKFSRRKLVKEIHYFDSVTDVLSKVAKEPGLIELDNEDDDVSKNEEKKPGVDGNDSPKRQRHCYLQPRRTPKRNTVVMKFTVVDTSLSGGKIRELRGLPSEISNVVDVQDCDDEESSSSDDEDSVLETDESETIDTAKSDEKSQRVCPDISKALVHETKNEEGFREKDQSRKNKEDLEENGRSRKNKDKGLHENKHSRKSNEDLHEKDQSRKNKNECLQENNHFRKNNEDIHKKDWSCNNDEGLQEKAHSRKNKEDLRENDLSRKNKDEGLQEKVHSRKNKEELQEKNQVSRKPSKSSLVNRKLEQGNVEHVGPTAKRCKTLTSHSRDETTNTGLCPTRVGPELENGISACSSGAHEVTMNSSSQVGSTSCSSSIENSQTRMLIDLNLPQISPESESGVFLTIESSKEQDSRLIKNQSLPKISTVDADLNPRRHSTRTRPPTTRALEALANGYLTVNRRRKVKDYNAPDDVASPKPSQRARVVVEPNESTNSSVASHVDQEGENGVSNSGNLNMFVKTEGPQEEEESISGQ